MQLTYNANMNPAIAGTLYDLTGRTVDSFAVETDSVYPGFGLVPGTDPGTQVKLPSAAVTNFAGIALLQGKEQNSAGNVVFGDEDSLSVLHKGRVWVPVTGAVAKHGQAYLVFSGANAGKFAAAAGGTAGTPAGVAAAGVGAAFAGNAANTGTITAAPATGAGCKAGTYRITCFAVAADSGKFLVEDPDGITIGTATVGAEFSTHLTFTIADGATDFKAGEGFTITVAAVAAVPAAPIATAIPGATFITSTTGAGIAVVELN